MLTHRAVFRATAAVVVVLGFLTLVLSEELTPAFILLIPPGIAFALWCERHPEFQRRLDPVNTYGFYPLAAFALADYFVLKTTFALVFVRFIVLLQLVRLAVPKTSREWSQILGLAFLQLLAGTILSFDLYFAVVLVLFLPTAALALVLLHLKTQWEAAHPPPPGGEAWPPGRLRPGLLGSLGVVTALVFAVTAAVFVVLPRVQFGMLDSVLSTTYGQGANLSGFSDTTSLGGRGAIADNIEPVMRIQLAEDDRHDPEILRRLEYWRGVSLDHFDGVTWRAAADNGRRGYGTVQTTDKPRPLDGWEEVRVEVLMEAANTNYIFHHSWMAFIDSKFMKFVQDPRSGVYRKPHSRMESKKVFDNSPYRYAVGLFLPKTGRLRESPGLNLRQETNRRTLESIYLQLPDSLDPRIAPLARERTEGLDEPLEQALELERWLSSDFAYDHNMPEVDPENPLGDFLFTARRGHCEYYASALAVMLRTIGIPARVVNGYLGGEYSNAGKYLVVRQLHAHSWTEALLPDDDGRLSWVTLDGTPADYRRERQEPKVGWLAAWIDVLDAEWSKRIIDYSIMNQRDAMVGAWSGIKGLSWRERQSSSGQPGSRWRIVNAPQLIIVLIAIGSSLALILWGRAVWLKRRQYSRPGGYYHRMLALLEQAGRPKPAGRTPAEHAALLAADPGLEAEARTIIRETTTRFLSERYGARPPTAEERERIGVGLRRLGQLLAGRWPTGG